MWSKIIALAGPLLSIIDTILKYFKKSSAEEAKKAREDYDKAIEKAIEEARKRNSDS